jgi:hypothetical protein
MDAYEVSAEQQGGTLEVHLDTPFFKHSFECTIKKTTQVQLEWLEKDKACFFPTAIYMTGILLNLLTTPTRPGPMPTFQDTKTSSSTTLWPTVTPVRTYFIMCGHYRTTLNLLT